MQWLLYGMIRQAWFFIMNSAYFMTRKQWDQLFCFFRDIVPYSLLIYSVGGDDLFETNKWHSEGWNVWGKHSQGFVAVWKKRKLTAYVKSRNTFIVQNHKSRSICSSFCFLLSRQWLRGRINDPFIYALVSLEKRSVKTWKRIFDLLLEANIQLNTMEPDAEKASDVEDSVRQSGSKLRFGEPKSPVTKVSTNLRQFSTAPSRDDC